MRYLSHSDTLRYFHRACSRADINLVYSRGFNPRPKISLPLPRSVAVESEDELLYLQIKTDDKKFDTQEILEKLSLQMSEGIVLLSAEVLKEKKGFNKGTVTYQINIGQANAEEVGKQITDLLSKDSVKTSRYLGPKKPVKEVEVRSYIKSIEQKDNRVQVDCTFGPAGTIRANEIVSLLGIEQQQLKCPVRRVKINWQ